MKRKHYRVIFIPAFICTLVLSLLAFYVLSVVNKSEALDIINSRLDIICETADAKITQSNDNNSRLYDSYCSKARAVSLLLSSGANEMEGEEMLEEVRVAIGAEVICVSDKNGVIQYSTEMSSAETSVFEEFMPAVSNRTFSDAITAENDYNSIYTGSSRLDEPGVIQIKFALNDYQNVSVADTLTNMSIMRHGHLAIIDETDYTYISHTDKLYNGLKTEFPIEEFSEDEGSFSSEYNRKNVLVSYKKQNGIIAIGFLPESEVYKQRNVATNWAIFSMLILTLVIALVLRNYVLRKMLKIKNKKSSPV